MGLSWICRHVSPDVAKKNFKGGRWTEDWCGGVSNGARVCLDAGGRIASALDDLARRHTSSDDLDLLRVVTGQWGARSTVPAGAAIPFKLRLLFYLCGERVARLLLLRPIVRPVCC